MTGMSPELRAEIRRMGDAGFSASHIASCLEITPTVVWRALKPEKTATRSWTAPAGASSEARARAEALFAKPVSDAPSAPVGRPATSDKIADLRTAAEVRLDRRRRFLLSLRFAREWDLVWFLTREGMSRPTLETHFGRDCISWSRGDGFNWRIPA